MTLKVDNVQLGSSITADKNIVLANDSVTGDLVISKGVADTPAGQVLLCRLPNGGLINYADDAAAQAGGVPVNTLYRTGSAVMVRVV